MATTRNVHIYVAYEVGLIQGWRDLIGIPAYEPSEFSLSAKDEKTLSPEEKEERRRKHERAEADAANKHEMKAQANALQQTHTAYVTKVAGFVFDFKSDEYNPAAAVPGKSAKTHYLYLEYPQCETPGATLLLQVYRWLMANDSKTEIDFRHVSWRGREPKFFQLLARNQVARVSETLGKLDLALYFQPVIFDWNSCFGAKSYGDTNVLLTQMNFPASNLSRVVPSESLSLLEELETSLSIFRRYGLAPAVDLSALV